MNIVLHGDDPTKSRQEFQTLLDKAKSEGKEIIRLEDNLSLNMLKQALESKSLFGGKKAVFLENVYSRRVSDERSQIISYLEKYTDIEPEIIIWESKSVRVTSLRKLPKSWSTKLFKLPVLLFKLLDSISPGKQSLFLPVYQKLLQDSAVELVFFMLIRRVRELILAKSLGREGLNGAPWQIGKLVGQAGAFELENLVMLYKKLGKIDFEIKSGQSKMDMRYHLDLWLADI